MQKFLHNRHIWEGILWSWIKKILSFLLVQLRVQIDQVKEPNSANRHVTYCN